VFHSLRYVPFLLFVFIVGLPQAGLKACTTPDISTPNVSATVAGVVLDPDGRPVPQAHVLVVQPVAIAVTTTTDAGGRFRIETLAAGTYELHVALEGFRAEATPFTLRPGETRDIDVRLRLSAVAESVVVTAAQVDVALTRVPGSMSVIAEEELRARQIETVADALRSVPGMFVARSGGRGALTSLFPRGGESDYTLVLVDGVRVNAFGGSFDFAQLPAAEVERVEVARGPQSALFGADAISGAIQIVTRHGGAPRVEGSVEGGGLGTVRGTFASAGSVGRWGWGGTGERIASDGFRGMAPASGERVSNDDYEHGAGSFSSSWRDQRTEARADVRFDRAERGFPGPFGSNPKGFFSGVDRISRGVTEMRTLSLAGTRLIGARVRLKGQFGDTDIDGEFTSPFSPDPSVDGTRRRAGRALVDATVSPTLGISAGVEALRERARSTYIVDAGGALIPVRRQGIGYFGEVRYAPHGSLSISSGLRIERIQRDRLAADPQQFVERPAFPTDTVVSVNPKLAAAWRLPGSTDSRWTRLRAGAGTGIRPPNAFEISFTDNPGLKPERSRSVEGAVEHGTAGGMLVLEAAAFWNGYDDLIVAIGPTFQDASRYKTDNIANARSRGIELTAATRARGGLRLRAGYTYLDTAVLAVDRTPGAAPAPFTPRDPLLRRPRHQGSIDVLFTRDRVTLFGALGARGRMLDVEPSGGAIFGGLFDAPGYAVLDAGATLRVFRRIAAVDVYGRVSNLLDRAYEETLGFPALGRTGIIGVRVAARR
jgi:outer membrane cobalamin receptor